VIGRFRRWMGTWAEARQSPVALARYGLGLLAIAFGTACLFGLPLAIVAIFWPLLGIDPHPNPIGLGLLFALSIPVVWTLVPVGVALILTAGVWQWLQTSK
jgi:hypothetical protein